MAKLCNRIGKCGILVLLLALVLRTTSCLNRFTSSAVHSSRELLGSRKFRQCLAHSVLQSTIGRREAYRLIDSANTHGLHSVSQQFSIPQSSCWIGCQSEGVETYNRICAPVSTLFNCAGKDVVFTLIPRAFSPPLVYFRPALAAVVLASSVERNSDLRP